MLEPGAKIVRSIVRGPAVIGPGATIEDAFIGPYTSIGDEVRIRRCEVEHSIVLANSTVEDLGTRMEASLLGRNVKLTRSEGLPKTLRLLVGDNSMIEIVQDHERSRSASRIASSTTVPVATRSGCTVTEARTREATSIVRRG